MKDLSQMSAEQLGIAHQSDMAVCLIGFLE